jgi:hypothetical protein
MKISTQMYYIVSRMIRWLIQFSKPELVQYQPYLDVLLHRLSKIHKSRGNKDFIRYNKIIRTNFLNYLCGSGSIDKSVRVTKEGIPLIFGDLIHILRKGSYPVSLLQMINTILFCTRSLSNVGTIVPDLSPIVDGPKNLEYPLYVEKHIKTFWKDLGYRYTDKVPSRLNFKRFKLSTSAGPVPGKYGNALFTSTSDLFSLNETLIKSIKIVGGNKMAETLDLLLSSKDIILEDLGFPIQESKLRRLTFFGDKEGKVRVVGILDYFSQSVLRPLHSYLFNVLKNIKGDCTFDQNKFKTDIANWDYFSSVDLTAATDRFPIRLISSVLNGRLPLSYVKAWEDIMVGYPFIINNKMISYSVGNPMGAYSSWASFTLAHHYIIYFCCKELNIPFKECKYFLLGDDIIIGQIEVANLYKKVILDLGLEFSKLKTYDSPYFCEFTKRIFYKGNEISPFPYSSLKNEGKYYYLLTNLLINMSERGWTFLGGIPSGVQSYYGMVRNLPSRIKKDIFSKSYVCELIIKIINGNLSAEELNKAFLALGFSFSPPLGPIECKSILENIVVEEFANSNPASNIKSKRKSIGLGLLASRLVEILTGLPDNKIERGISLIYALPVLNSYSRIEELYIKLSQKAFKMSEWPLTLKTMAIPWDDRVFIRSESHIIVRASLSIISSLKDRALVLKSYPQLRNIDESGTPL